MRFCCVSIEAVASQSVAVLAKSVNAAARYGPQVECALTVTCSFGSA